MARIEGSFPVKLNDRVVGRAYVVGQDSTGLIVDIRIDNFQLLESITEITRRDRMPNISFGLNIEPDKPTPTFEPAMWDAVDEVDKAVAGMSQKEKDEYIRNYVQARYMRTDKDLTK